MNNEHLLLNDAARILGKKPYQITYAITSGAVKDVMRIGGRRIFQRKDIKRLAKHFGVEPKSANSDTALGDQR